jgi:TPR repeat protein
MAMKFYEIAGKGGNAKAKFNIALMYNRGEGVVADDEIASTYMEDAALHGT